MESIYEFEIKGNNGKIIDFNNFKGKVLLLVNTASNCGFTPQYKGLEELYKKYEDKGLVVIGFPCNQFGKQEPGNDTEIASFCELNFGVSFPLTQKVEVNGENATPIFKYLKKHTSGLLGSKIKWNFTKFLISSDGKTIRRFSPMKKPKSLEKSIIQLLEKQGK